MWGDVPGNVIPVRKGETIDMVSGDVPNDVALVGNEESVEMVCGDVPATVNTVEEEKSLEMLPLVSATCCCAFGACNLS